MKYLSTGEVARKSNVNRETVRYYESQGLIPQPVRSSAGYRQYPPEVVERITFIKRLQKLGFTLSEIHGLLAIMDAEQLDCSGMQKYTRHKLEDIRQRIKDLQDIERILFELLQSCPAEGSLQNCPIIDTLKDKDEIRFDKE